MLTGWVQGSCMAKIIITGLIPRPYIILTGRLWVLYITSPTWAAISVFSAHSDRRTITEAASGYSACTSRVCSTRRRQARRPSLWFFRLLGGFEGLAANHAEKLDSWQRGQAVGQVLIGRNENHI